MRPFGFLGQQNNSVKIITTKQNINIVTKSSNQITTK